MRVRGLKPVNLPLRVSVILVAPHAGAWIETLIVLICPHEIQVAPHAGAWIETKLKIMPYYIKRVAPHAGAWIET